MFVIIIVLDVSSEWHIYICILAWLVLVVPPRAVVKVGTQVEWRLPLNTLTGEMFARHGKVKTQVKWRLPLDALPLTCITGWL